jgi:hypothetical protein
MVENAETDSPTIAQLRLAVQQAREDVLVARRLDGIDRHQLTSAQRHLLSILEVYLAALDAAGLAPHWQLRTEVHLLRGVTDTTPRPREGRPTRPDRPLNSP